VLGDLLSCPGILADSDKHVTGYSHGDLQSALAELPHSLLQDIMYIPVAQNCWLYFGEKIFPSCIQVLVFMAREFMREAEGTLTACPQLEAFVHMLGDFRIQACLHGCRTVAVCPHQPIMVCHPSHERSLSQLLRGVDVYHRQHSGSFACMMMATHARALLVCSS